ncbi:MAG: VIT domain-containing protein [Candidatus Kapaibacterium sp.]
MNTPNYYRILILVISVFSLQFPLLSHAAPVKEDTASRVSIRHTQAPVPALLVKSNDGASIPLHIERLRVSVEIVASIAVTTMEITFRNDQNRILEGELNFPLGNGQTVSRFAMDFNGSLREGVVVEKAKGREIFEEKVRQNIDPGLVELTRGNSFKARVYPIPAHGIKKIVVAYQQELSSDGTGDLRYSLPLDYKDTLTEFTVNAHVLSTLPPVTAQGALTGAFTQESGDAGYALRMKYYEYQANTPLEFSVPQATTKTTIYLESLGGKTYFYIAAHPPVSSMPKQLPRALCILWDASGSAGGRDIDRELSLLDAYFKAIGNCTVTLVTFSNAPDKPQQFTVSGGNWSALQALLKAVKYDGGTQLGALHLQDYKCDEYLLFSDGISNVGSAEIMLAKKPVIAINSTQHAEHSYLKYCAQATGGTYIDLSSIANENATRQLTEQPFSFIAARNTSGIRELVPSITTPVHDGMTLAGELVGNSTEITLEYGFGNKVTYSEKITLDKSTGMVKTGLIPNLWAQKKLAELDMRYKEQKDAITAIGKEFSIVTRNTSLLVLDRIEDYVEHGIIPKEDSLQQLYTKMIAEQTKRITDDGSKHLESVVAMMKERKEWWDKSFEPKVITRDTIQGRGNIVRDTQSRVTILTGRDTTVPANTGILTGRVIDSSGMPISGASILVQGSNRGGNAKLNGSFTITKIPIGRYQILIRSVGLKKYTTTVEILPQQTTEIIAKMLADPITLNFDIVAQREAPIIHRDQVGTIRVSGSENMTLQTETIRSEVAMGGASAAVSDAARPSGAPSILTASVTDRLRFAVDFNTDDETSNYRNPPTLSSSIELKKWDASAPYLKKLHNVARGEEYSEYLTLKKEYGASPGFYLDCADYFAEKGMKSVALRILTNIAEMELENHQLLRVLAHRLSQLGYTALAIDVFRDVLEMREEEPQSYRDLALALAEDKQYQAAADTLYRVITKKWDSRFSEVELIALSELNHVLYQSKNTVKTAGYDSRLLAHMPVDVRVVLNWDADNCDMDLWVFDPNNEKCFYSNRRTRIGGLLSRDMTGGYGPEEFLLKKALPGKYSVQVQYFGSRQQKAAAPTTIQLELYTRYATGKEEKKEITMRLKDPKQVIDVGEFMFVEGK